MDFAFCSIKDAVEAAWVSDGYILMQQNRGNTAPLDPIQNVIHLRWLSHFTASQGLARETIIRHAIGQDTALLAQYDVLQAEAKALIGQGQRMAQQAALLHLRASDKEKAARLLFDPRHSSLPKGSPENKDSKAPERHARDLAIFTMAGIVRPQNAESFGEDCADILAPAKNTLSKDMQSQLKNATQQNVIYSDAQHVVMETLLALKNKKREQNTHYTEERGRTRARGALARASTDKAMEGPSQIPNPGGATTDTGGTLPGGLDIQDILAALPPDLLSALIQMLRGRDPVLAAPLTRQNSLSVERTVRPPHLTRRDHSVG